MGRWGEGLFEGDVDLDFVSEISQDAGMELLNYDMVDPKEPQYSGKGLEATRNHLNNGTLDRLFKEYATKSMGGWAAALPMRVGATISPSDMETVRTSIPKLRVSPKYSWPLSDSHFRGPAKVQIETALKFYKNDGTPYDFYCDRCDGPGCGKAVENLAAGENLSKCGKCREVYYCGRDCQKAVWPVHKRTCKTLQQREQEDSGLPWKSLNV